MRALVISGGGSKGAFAGGVAEYLLENKAPYDMFIGTSTGSLLISHLALGKVEKIKQVYTHVSEADIFSVCPFKIKERHGHQDISIDHLQVLRNFMRGSKTFGESHRLLDLIKNTITPTEFETLKHSQKELVVTVSNLSRNRIEYKRLADFDYETFMEWVWISCNYTPFMSLVRKEGCEYADGGLGTMVPIEEAVKRGATHIDAIVLQTEVTQLNRMPSRNPFSLLTSMFAFMLDRIEKQNIRIGKFAASHVGSTIDFYYTPTVLTTNSLIFDSKKMTDWWQRGYRFAQKKDTDTSAITEEVS
ncbi:patatin-like phospholipase family protein [Sediminicola luteus]|uniref:Patatin n=1 Tax=Sediminicola luteus TaxID=319238 RepID=A0A2A4G7P7_9FLAO|nr:patatin-like phospholipase family protein [Sediminicola luteus]PCE64016.1 patatin [Sediminicola luteus]